MRRMRVIVSTNLPLPKIRASRHQELAGNQNPTNIQLRFQSLQVVVCPAKHPDGERKFEVWVRDHAILIEHPFNRFLRPRSILVGQELSTAHGEHMTAIVSHRKLSGHDQFDRPLNRFRVRIFGIHQSHRCPASLHNLGIFVFNPATELTTLHRLICQGWVNRC